VYLHSERGVCTLEGATVHAWLTRLQPFLTGEHTLDELTAALPGDQRDTVDQLVQTLYEQGLVVDVRTDRPHSLSVAECQTYAEEIGFVRYSLDSAEYRFQQYRQARVTLIGSGPVLTALLDTGLRSGLRSIRIAGCNQEEIPQLRQVVQRARRDDDQHVDIDSSALVTDDALTAVIEASDVVLQVCTPAAWTSLVTVARECGRAGKIVGQLLVDRVEAWIGPVGRSVAESGWRRLCALRPACSDQDAHEQDGGPNDWVTGPVPAVIASQVALACFRHLTGMDELPRHGGQGSLPVMTRVDLRTLDARTHRFVPHPLATPADAVTERQIRAAIEAYASGPPVSPQELLDRSETIVDARCGLFGWLDEDNLTQLPLWVCRAGISDPCCVLPAWAPTPTVTGHGLDRDDARLSALLDAFATYGSLALDRRRLLERGGMGDAGRTPGVWGMDLATGRMRTVPVSVALPALNGVVVPYRAPVGAAAGLTWNRAVSAALRQHCELLLAQRLAVADRPCPRLDPVQVTGDERVVRLLRLLTATREPVEIYDLDNLLGLPACAVLTGGITVALACGTTMAHALAAGLERALLAWQARHENQPDYAPPTVPQLDERLRGPAASDVLPTEDMGCTTLVDALRTAGHTPVVVPLDHDPEATQILPYTVQVVLCRD
jgi:hypothetical protein